MDDEGASSPPCVVLVSAFSGYRRRLSTSFVDQSRRRPVPSSEKLKPMAWISLNGRLLNADEASSAQTIGGGLSAKEGFAWNLFPPIHRFLIVAVIGAAVARSRKDIQICQLKKSVQLRDQVLSSMQQKLDSLCELVNNSKEHCSTESCDKDGVLQSNETFGAGKTKFVDCGCCHCEQHSAFFNELMGACAARSSGGANDEVLQYKTPFSNDDQEERRMSDMSDWASSVTSSADIQLNNLAVEQDIYNLRRDCEEKDTTIKELTTLLSSNEVANCKRTAELEDIIRRKNTTISKLKKDMLVLEQKVVQLTRLRRPSFPASCSNDSQLPHIMIDNLLYDMESTSNPSSSSDSDSSSVLNQDSASKIDPKQKLTSAKVSSSSGRVFERHSKSRSVSPRKEVSSSRKSLLASSSVQKQLSARGDLKKSRRRSLNGDKSTTAHKRWV